MPRFPDCHQGKCSSIPVLYFQIILVALRYHLTNMHSRFWSILEIWVELVLLHSLLCLIAVHWRHHHSEGYQWRHWRAGGTCGSPWPKNWGRGARARTPRTIWVYWWLRTRGVCGTKLCIKGNLLVSSSQMFYTETWSHFFPFVLNPCLPKQY